MKLGVRWGLVERIRSNPKDLIQEQACRYGSAQQELRPPNSVSVFLKGASVRLESPTDEAVF